MMFTRRGKFRCNPATVSMGSDGCDLVDDTCYFTAQHCVFQMFCLGILFTCVSQRDFSFSTYQRVTGISLVERPDASPVEVLEQ